MNPDPIVIGGARSGRPTASAGKARIHSGFDPEKEAARFIDGLDLETSPGGVIVILGAGLGYLDADIAKRHPDRRLIALHMDETLYRKRIREDRSENRVMRWHPGSGVDAETFLFEALDETDIAGLKVVEWPGSAAARPQQAEAVRNAAVAVVRRYTGNISATAAFGRHWIRNIIRNYLETDVVAVPFRDDAPVVLAASGPSLEDGLEFLSENRRAFRLWALPSSLAALHRAEMVPDLVFSTDPGYWARLHGRYFPSGVPVAMPLSAAPRPVESGPPLLIPQDTPGEMRLLEGNHWPILPLPAMGTVAATAVAAWERISAGPLILAGLDLSWNDLRSHVRPHAFDPWISAATDRRRPELTVRWERAAAMAPVRKGPMRTGPSMDTYADWFRGSLSGKNVLRFESSGTEFRPFPLPDVPAVDDSAFAALLRRPASERRPEIVPAPVGAEERRRAVRRLIAGWRKSLEDPVQRSDREMKQLMYALDPGGVLEKDRLFHPERASDFGDRSGDSESRHLRRITEILDRLAVRCA